MPRLFATSTVAPDCNRYSTAAAESPASTVTSTQVQTARRAHSKSKQVREILLICSGVTVYTIVEPRHQCFGESRAKSTMIVLQRLQVAMTSRVAHKTQTSPTQSYRRS
jgi:hypothetical protein